MHLLYCRADEAGIIEFDAPFLSMFVGEDVCEDAMALFPGTEVVSLGGGKYILSRDCQRKFHSASAAMKKKITSMLEGSVGFDLEAIVVNKKENQSRVWESFDEYSDAVKRCRQEIESDGPLLSKLAEFHPGVDILKSIDKSIFTFWGVTAGYTWALSHKYKDPKKFLVNAIDRNKVYLPRSQSLFGKQQSAGRPGISSASESLAAAASVFGRQE